MTCFEFNEILLYIFKISKKPQTTPTFRIIGEERTQWNRRLLRSNHYTQADSWICIIWTKTFCND